MSSSNEVVLSYGDCLLRRSDVDLLKGADWLNDALIGFYFEYLDRKFNTENKKKYVFVSPELAQLLKMTDPSQYNIFLDPIGAADANFIYFPLNNCENKESAGGSHWSLLVYSTRERMCYHFDSSRGLNRDTASHFSRNIVQYFSGNLEKRITDVSCPQQDNGYDCGIYVLCFVDKIMENLLQTDTINNCEFSFFRKLAGTKRSDLLNLIHELKSQSND